MAIPGQFLGNTVCGPSESWWALPQPPAPVGWRYSTTSSPSTTSTQMKAPVLGWNHSTSTSSTQMQLPETPTVSFPGQSATKLELHKGSAKPNDAESVTQMTSRSDILPGHRIVCFSVQPIFVLKFQRLNPWIH